MAKTHLKFIEQVNKSIREEALSELTERQVPDLFAMLQQMRENLCMH